MKILLLTLILTFSCLEAVAVEGAPVLLIATSAEFSEYAESLAELHRERLSMPAAAILIDKTSSSESVRLKIKDEYDSSGGALKYLIIYGTDWTDAAGDAYFGMVKGALSPLRVPFTVPAIAVGRIPVGSEFQAREYNEKIQRYLDSLESSVYSNRILLAADDGDNLTHMADAEDTAGILAADCRSLLHKVYVGEYGLVNGKSADCRRRMMNVIEDGVGLMIYIGHGDYKSITGEGLMDSYDGHSMRNEALPWGFLSSCSTGKFGGSSMGFTESLLFNGSGGVIGCIASTQDVYASYNRMLVLAFSRFWTARGRHDRFGDIWLATQRECMMAAASQANKTLGLNTLSFNLLGDPSLPVKTPMEIESCGYDREQGVISGVMEGCPDGALVRVEIYSEMVRNGSVRHGDIHVGKSVGKVMDEMFEIPVKLDSMFQSALLRAEILSVSDARLSAYSSYVDFCYEHKDSENDHDPVIMSCRYEDGFVVADVVAGSSGVSEDNSVVGRYSKCEIDGRQVLPMSVSEMREGGFYRMKAKLNSIAPGRHSAIITVVDNKNRRVRRKLDFSTGAVGRLDLSCEKSIVRHSLSLSWEPVASAPVILKITDSAGNIVNRADVSGTGFYQWNLENLSGARVPTGVYYCSLIASGSGLSSSERLLVTVLPE